MHLSSDARRSRKALGASLRRAWRVGIMGFSTVIGGVGCADDPTCHFLSTMSIDVTTLCGEVIAISPDTEVDARFRRVGTSDWLPCHLVTSNDRDDVTGTLCPANQADISVQCPFDYSQPRPAGAPSTMPFDFEIELQVGEFFGRRLMDTPYGIPGCVPAHLDTSLELSRE